MPWPQPVINQFEHIPVNPSEAEYYGPYNKLLYTLFPAHTEFTVAPQYMPNSRKAIDFLILFEVKHENKVVFILEVKPPGDLGLASRREAADDQVRERIKDLSDACPLPVLHAVSAIGTKLCFYTKRRNQRINPPVIQPNTRHESDTAPRARWDCDILEGAGEQRFRAMVEEIKKACDALGK